MIYIASDHGGFELKKGLLNFFNSQSIPVEDLGPFTYTHDDDYPDYAIPALKKTQEDLKNNKCILICRNGVGVSMLANKLKGIKACLSWDPVHAKSSRTDDNTNVLCLPSDYIGEQTAKFIVQNWLETPFSDDERHIRRLKKVENLER